MGEEIKENGWIQFCIILNEGSHAGIKHYLPVSRARMEQAMGEVFNRLEFVAPDKRAYFDIGHITKNKGDKVSFVKGLSGSLQVCSKNGETAKNCFEKFFEYYKIKSPL